MKNFWKYFLEKNKFYSTNAPIDINDGNPN